MLHQASCIFHQGSSLCIKKLTRHLQGRLHHTLLKKRNNFLSLWQICKMSSVEDMESQTILCFGDSLTEGWYADGLKFHPYTIRLAELINADESFRAKYKVVNAGLSGECVIDEMSQRLPELLKSVKPLKLVIILGGTNDLASLSKCKSRDLPNEIRKLHLLVHQSGVKTCAMTLPEADAGYLPMTYIYEEYRQEVNESIKEFANEHADNVILCDIGTEHPMLDLTDEEREKYWDDDVHCTPAGYDKMGEIIFNHIKTHLSSNF